ncbi:MAG: hypothetical protein ACLSAF_14380 [Intestinimonas sp.]
MFGKGSGTKICGAICERKGVGALFGPYEKEKGRFFLCLVFLFPFFPDDIICILAGLTDIKRTRFAMIVVLFRPWGLLVACGVGGSVISIPLWGMVLIGIAGAILFLVGLKYGDRVEACLLERMKKR